MSRLDPLLTIDLMVSNEAGGHGLVKVEAAVGGGRRPAFTRACPPSHNHSLKSVDRTRSGRIGWPLVRFMCSASDIHPLEIQKSLISQSFVPI